MKKFSYNKIFCDICGVKGDFVASSSNQPCILLILHEKGAAKFAKSFL